jgi:hypothetical protein
MLVPEDDMVDDKTKRGDRDRDRISLSEPYEIEYFRRKHPHLTEEEAVAIIRDEGGDREKADAAGPND